MLLLILKILVGFAFLIFGGDAIVKGSVSFAKKMKIPTHIIGLTVVAAGTSAPELITSVMALLKGATDITITNVIGSNLFNMLIVLGTSALFIATVVKKNILKIDLPLFVLFNFIFIYFLWDLKLTALEAGIQLLLVAGFICISCKTSCEDPTDEDFEGLPLWQEIGFTLAGFVGLIFGAKLALEGSLAIGESLGWSQRFLGVFVLSVGTSLPELFASLAAIYRGHSDLALGNVIGSNLLNMFGVTGVAGLIKPFGISPKVLSVDAFFMLGITVFLLLFIYINKKRIDKKMGFIFLGLYLVYAFVFQMS